MAIIGEAVNKFIKEETGICLNHSREIINFRNRIIHAYDSIDDSIVWVIQKKHLPELKNEINKILEL